MDRLEIIKYNLGRSPIKTVDARWLISEIERLRKVLEDARYSFWEISHRAIGLSRNYKDAIKAGRKIDQALKEGE